MIEIDGSQGEGGGQILRTAVALSTVLNRAVRVSRIRAGRTPPGLKAQHLTGVRAAAQLCNASIKEAGVGSTELVYQPGPIRRGSFSFDVGTAGSITLVLQTVMPILAFASGEVGLKITGGTDVRWSPPVDYLKLVTLPQLSRLGYQGGLELRRRGHYPKGGGEVGFTSSPCDGLRPLKGLTAGDVVEIQGVSHVTGLPRHIAERQTGSARDVITKEGLPPPNIEVETAAGPLQGTGSGIVLFALGSSGTALGSDSLGEKGKPAELVGEEAGRRLVEEVRSNAFLDRHMGDMVIPYIALARGTSEVSVSQVTQHTLTNIHVAEQLANVKFEVEGGLGQRGIIRVDGLGLRIAEALS